MSHKFLTYLFLILIGNFPLLTCAQNEDIKDSISSCDTIQLVDGRIIYGHILELSVADLAYSPCGSDSIVIKYISKKNVSNLKALKLIYDNNGDVRGNSKTKMTNAIGLHANINIFPKNYESPLLYGLEYQKTLKQVNNRERKFLVDFNVGILSKSDGDIKDITIIGGSMGYGWNYHFGRFSILTSFYLSYMYYYSNLRTFTEPDIYGPNIVTKANLIGLIPELSLGFDITEQLTLQSSVNISFFNHVGAFVDRIWIMSTKIPALGLRYRF